MTDELELANGIEHVIAGNYGDALTALQRYLAANALDAQGWFYLGVSQHELALTREAQDSLQRAVELDPMHVLAHRELGRALIAQGCHHRAVDVLERAVSLDGSALNCFYLGLANLRAGMCSEARRSFEAAVERDPHYEEAWLHLALASDATGHSGYANKCLHAAIDAAPEYALARFERALGHLRRGDHAAAEADFRVAVADTESGPWPRLLLANLLWRRALLDEAEDLYREAVSDDDGSFVAHCALAQFFQAVGRVPDALSVLDNAYALSPHNVRVLIERGHVLYAALDFARSADAFHQALCRCESPVLRTQIVAWLHTAREAGQEHGEQAVEREGPSGQPKSSEPLGPG